LPWHYRVKLARFGAGRLSWLRRNEAQLWVSTAYLQEKYASWRPRLVLPASATDLAEPRRVFYHGTGSHIAEIRWLRPVMEEALRRDPALSFEVVGSQRVNRLYRELPRVTVVHQMKWPAYQAFLSMPGRHIGLAPLLDGPFNRARSYTKFFDITRCGAPGIYSALGACAEVVTPGVDGLVVEMKPEAWVDAIARLARDDALRQTLLDNARRKVAELAQRAQAGYPDLTAGWSRARDPS
jgi:glycosyltransferase involved in cell wall biosynthesis